jgi:CheY-like chemotaxis protein
MPAKLLLADDSVTIQRVIELTFADEDIQVHAVGDGRAAIEHIQRERPDIVLADVGMPERDGYEVAAFLKGTPETAHIPVLLLTGAFEPVDETRARAVGCAGVLVKPFEPQVVISRVKDLLSGRQPEGLWAKPSAQSPVRPAAAGAAAVTAGEPGASLEDYFDRLDAAFASLETATPQAAPIPARQAAPAAAGGDFAEDLAGLLSDAPPRAAQPAEPAAAPLATPPSASSGHPPAPELAPAEPVAAAAPASNGTRIDVPPGPGPSLAEAFAALLAAEQGQPFAPAGRAPAAPPPVADDVVEAIVRRVVAEMSGQAVRDTVLDVAERLVREEIARIKAAHPA